LPARRRSDQEPNHATGSRSNLKEIAIDVNDFFAVMIAILSLQTPYLTRQEMEERLGHKLSTFEKVDDKFLAPWLLKNQQ
jgi:hypothetical protein